MAGRTLSVSVLVLGLVLALPAAAEEIVHFPSLDADLTHGGPTSLSALLFRPQGRGPFPAVVMLHGCGGMWTARGRLGARDRDWAERFAAAGFAALEVDSLTPRGLGSLCRIKERPIAPGRERARDAHAAFAWLAARDWIRKDRIALVGWSHGGSTVLWTVNETAPGRPTAGPDFRLAVAFYPGCRPMARSPHWRPRLPLTILIGGNDDWTPFAPCNDLVAGRPGPVDLVVYPGAYHDFDYPRMALRTRSGIPLAPDGSGIVHIGTDPVARADAIRRVMALLAPLATD